MKLQLKSFWGDEWYFPLIQLSYSQYEFTKYRKMFQIGFIGFCLTIKFDKDATKRKG